MTKVEFIDDSDHPGRRIYRIFGDTKDEVDGIVDARMAWVEKAGGYAGFTSVRQLYDRRWMSLGEVILGGNFFHAN